MKKMKLAKIFCLVFVVSGLLALAACGQTSQTENMAEDSVQSSETDTSVQSSEMKTTEDSVTYELSIRSVGRNEEIITSNEISVPSGDYVLSLSERISDDVVNGTVEGDFIEGGVQNAIVDIDYPYEMSGLDGTVVVAMEYTLSDIPTGQVITVTLSEELQNRLGLPENQIVISCIGYEDQLLGAWEMEITLPIIASEDSELPAEVEAIWRFEFNEDGTGKWLTIVDEQYTDLYDDTDIIFTYTLDGDNLELIRENGNAMPYIISFVDDNLIMDGRTYMELTPVK